MNWTRCACCYDTALPANGCGGGCSPALRMNGYKDPNIVVIKYENVRTGPDADVHELD